MLDVMGMIAALERTGLLVRAARFGMSGHGRSRCVARLVDASATLRTGEIILRLLEAELEDRRRAHDAGYPVRRQLEVLTALLGEARVSRDSLLLRRVA